MENSEIIISYSREKQHNFLRIKIYQRGLHWQKTRKYYEGDGKCPAVDNHIINVVYRDYNLPLLNRVKQTLQYSPGLQPILNHRDSFIFKVTGGEETVEDGNK